MKFLLIEWVFFYENQKKREYVEALEKEMISRNNLASVKQLLQEARNEVSVQLMTYNQYNIKKMSLTARESD